MVNEDREGKGLFKICPNFRAMAGCTSDRAFAWGLRFVWYGVVVWGLGLRRGVFTGWSLRVYLSLDRRE